MQATLPDNAPISARNHFDPDEKNAHRKAKKDQKKARKDNAIARNCSDVEVVFRASSPSASTSSASSSQTPSPDEVYQSSRANLAEIHRLHALMDSIHRTPYVSPNWDDA